MILSDVNSGSFPGESFQEIGVSLIREERVPHIQRPSLYIRNIWSKARTPNSKTLQKLCTDVEDLKGNAADNTQSSLSQPWRHLSVGDTHQAG